LGHSGRLLERRIRTGQISRRYFTHDGHQTLRCGIGGQQRRSLKNEATLDEAGVMNQWPALCNAAGQAFCNASPFRLKDLTSRAKAQTLKK